MVIGTTMGSHIVAIECTTMDITIGRRIVVIGTTMGSNIVAIECTTMDITIGRHMVPIDITIGRHMVPTDITIQYIIDCSLKRSAFVVNMCVWHFDSGTACRRRP